jgi:hypothetical protein
MNYQQIRNFRDRFKASYTVKQFDELLPLFQEEPLLPKYAAKAHCQLTTAEDKLFFILYYQKNNPTQEALAFAFGLSQDRANKWIGLLVPILFKALKFFKPETNPYRLDSQLCENQEYIIDATQRPIQRDSYVQQEYYSGKKNAYYKKSINY